MYFVKLTWTGLLRGDYQSRMNGYSVGRQNGWLSANDIREMEDMNPIPAEEGGELVPGERESLQAGRCGAVCGEGPAGAGAAGREDFPAGLSRTGAVRHGNMKA